MNACRRRQESCIFRNFGWVFTVLELSAALTPRFRQKFETVEEFCFLFAENDKASRLPSVLEQHKTFWPVKIIIRLRILLYGELQLQDLEKSGDRTLWAMHEQALACLGPGTSTFFQGEFRNTEPLGLAFIPREEIASSIGTWQCGNQ